MREVNARSEEATRNEWVQKRIETKENPRGKGGTGGWGWVGEDALLLFSSPVIRTREWRLGPMGKETWSMGLIGIPGHSTQSREMEKWRASWLQLVMSWCYVNYMTEALQLQDQGLSCINCCSWSVDLLHSSSGCVLSTCSSLDSTPTDVNPGEASTEENEHFAINKGQETACPEICYPGFWIGDPGQSQQDNQSNNPEPHPPH